MSMQSGFDINQLVKEAQTRWLKPAEVHFILQNHESYQITEEPPKKPPSGSLFLFNKRVLRFFRRDGHSWRKKKDGRSVGEAHERLKVGNVEALNCYYAHGEENPNFQRRSFWMLDPAYEHIVLVHYREISEGRLSSGLMSELSPGCSSTLSQSPSSYTTQNPCSISFTDLRDSYRNHTSPGSTEVSSETIATDNASYHCDGIDRSGNLCTSSEVEVGQALRKLEEQLSLDDESFKDYVPADYQDANANGFGSVHDPCYSGYAGVRSDLNGDCKVSQSHSFGKMQRVENGESLSWSDVLELFEGPVHANSAGERAYMSNGNGNQSSPLSRTIEHRKNDQSQSVYATDSKEDLMLLVKDVENLSMPTHSLQTYNSESCTTLLDQGQFGMLPVSDSSLTIAQDQRFTIREVSPEWGFTTESTKVIIIGSFLCNPTECEWACMFGDVEVPLQIIQDGVFSCQAPPHHPGKVTLCITSGNRESCSEVREFEYRDKHSSCSHCHTRPQGEATRSTEELLLLVRFAQMLLCNSSPEKEDSNELGIDLAAKLKTDEDLWGQIIEALLVGSWTSSATVDWLLQELLKDKLQQWVSSKSQENSVSKKEQGVIHMIAALGYEWALNPILRCGVGVNFRDLNGWTALHWAARFGREKMVAALIASGASAVAVTDPNSQDPTGKPPASIAEENGHKGLAGYLSEVSLTSHLSSLTLEETELAKGSADVQAELAVNNISNASVASTEDQVSMKHTLAAVRNAAQAAARIQSAFRAHSFRKRQDREAAMAADEYGFNTKDIKGLSAMSKLAFRNKAALSIQKNYRGWKGRKDFLTLRQKVVKIQAHVRGYQVRKKYKVICWAVGVLDKVVLRWRRKGAGLRGFKHESECINESEEDEDIVKVFRKEKVNVAIDEAVTRVLSMVESPEARKQYQRVLERCQEAKAELGALQSEGASASRVVASDMDDDDIFRFL